MRELAKAGVMWLGFLCGGGGTPLFTAGERELDIAWQSPNPNTGQAAQKSGLYRLGTVLRSLPDRLRTVSSNLTASAVHCRTGSIEKSDSTTQWTLRSVST
jgi:hypothetical protein